MAKIKFAQSGQSRYTNALHTSYHKALYAIISSVPAPDLKAWRIQSRLSDWKASIDMEVEINREASASIDTQTLDQLDKQRDRITGYIFGAIRLERTLGLLDARVQAAQRLAIITKTYGRLQLEAYKEQSVHTDGLINDLQKPQQFQDLKTLGLDAFVSQLKTVNEQFQNAMNTRTVTRAQTQLPTAKVQRRVSDDILSDIQERIKASHIVSDTASERERIAALVGMMNKVSDEHRARYNQATGNSGGTSGNTTPGIQPGGGGGGNSPEDEPKADGE